MILKQINLTHTWDSKRYYQFSESRRGCNCYERVLPKAGTSVTNAI